MVREGHKACSEKNRIIDGEKDRIAFSEGGDRIARDEETVI